MHYLYRYVCILNVFFYICIWTIVCNKEFIIRKREIEREIERERDREKEIERER